ncbi:hypothetical protein ACFE04_001765 [Oxalis oulophora]
MDRTRHTPSDQTQQNLSRRVKVHLGRIMVLRSGFGFITHKSVPYSSNPIVLRVDVLEGLLRVGTPICIPQIQFMDIGRVSSIEINHEPVEDAFHSERVDITEEQIRFLTHFGMDDQLVSRISLRSMFSLLDRHPHLSFGVLASLLRLMEL